MKYFYSNFVDDLKTRVSNLILQDDPHDKVFALFKDYFYKEDFDSCLEILETLNNLQKEDDEVTIGASCCALESLINSTYSLFLGSFPTRDKILKDQLINSPLYVENLQKKIIMLPVYMDKILIDFFHKDKHIVMQQLIEGDVVDLHKIKSTNALKLIIDSISTIANKDLQHMYTNSLVDFIVEGIFNESFFHSIDDDYFALFEMIMRLFQAMKETLVEEHYQKILTAFKSVLEDIQESDREIYINDFKMLKAVTLHLHVTVPMFYKFEAFDCFSFFIKQNILSIKKSYKELMAKEPSSSEIIEQQNAAKEQILEFFKLGLVQFSDCWHKMLLFFCETLEAHQTVKDSIPKIIRKKEKIKEDIGKLRKNTLKTNPKQKSSSSNSEKEDFYSKKEEELSQLDLELSTLEDSLYDPEKKALLETNYSQIIQMGFLIRQEFKMHGIIFDDCKVFPVNDRLFSFGLVPIATKHDIKSSKESYIISSNFVKLLMRNDQFEDCLKYSDNCSVETLANYIKDIDRIYDVLISGKSSSLAFPMMRNINMDSVPIEPVNVEFIGTAFASFVSHLSQGNGKDGEQPLIYNKNILESIKTLAYIMRFYTLNKDRGFDSSSIILPILKNHLTKFIWKNEHRSLWEDFMAVILEFTLLDSSYQKFSIDFLMPNSGQEIVLFEVFSQDQLSSYLQLILSTGIAIGKVDYVRGEIEKSFFSIIERKILDYDVDDNDCLKIFSVVKSISLIDDPNKPAKENVKISGILPVESNDGKYYERILKNLTPEYWQNMRKANPIITRNILNILIVAINVSNKDTDFLLENIPEFFNITIEKKMCDSFLCVISLAVLSIKQVLAKKRLSKSDMAFLSYVNSSEHSDSGVGKVFGYDIIRDKGYYLFSDFKFVESALDGLMNLGNIFSYLHDKHSYLDSSVSLSLVKIFNNMHSLLQERYDALKVRLKDPRIKENFNNFCPKMVNICLERQLLPHDLHYCLSEFFDLYKSFAENLRAFKYSAFGDFKSGNSKVCNYFKLNFAKDSSEIIYYVSVDNISWYSFPLKKLVTHTNYHDDIFPYKLMLLPAEDKTMSVTFFDKDGQNQHKIEVSSEGVSLEDSIGKEKKISIPETKTDISQSFNSIYASNTNQGSKLKKLWSKIISFKKELMVADQDLLKLIFSDVDKYKVPAEILAKASCYEDFQMLLSSIIFSKRYFTLDLMTEFFNIRSILSSEQERDLLESILKKEIVEDKDFLNIIRALFLSRDSEKVLSLCLQLLKSDKFQGDRNYNLSSITRIADQEFFQNKDLINLFNLILCEFTSSKGLSGFRRKFYFKKFSDFYGWANKNSRTFRQYVDLSLSIDGMSNISYSNLEIYCAYRNWREVVVSSCDIDDLVFWTIYLRQKYQDNSIENNKFGLKISGISSEFSKHLNNVFSKFIGCDISLAMNSHLSFVSRDYSVIYSNVSFNLGYEDLKRSLKSARDSLLSQIDRRKKIKEKSNDIYDKFKSVKLISRNDLEFLEKNDPEKIDRVISSFQSEDYSTFSILELYKFWVYISRNEDILCSFILSDSNSLVDQRLVDIKTSIELQKQVIFSKIASITDFFSFLDKFDIDLKKTILSEFVDAEKSDFFASIQFKNKFWASVENNSSLEQLSFYMTSLGLISSTQDLKLRRHFLEMIEVCIERIYGATGLCINLDVEKNQLSLAKNDIEIIFNLRKSFSHIHEKVKSLKQGLVNIILNDIKNIIDSTKMPSLIELKYNNNSAELSYRKSFSGFNVRLAESKVDFVKIDDAYKELKNLILDNEKTLDSNFFLRMRSILPAVYLEFLSNFFSNDSRLKVTGYFSWVLSKVINSKDNLPSDLKLLISNVETITILADYDDEKVLGPLSSSLEKSSFYKAASGASPCLYYRNSSTSMSLGVRIKKDNDGEYLVPASYIYTLGALGVIPEESKIPPTNRIKREGYIAYKDDSLRFFGKSVQEVREIIWRGFPWSLARLSKWVKRFSQKDYQREMSGCLTALNVAEISSTFTSLNGGDEWVRFIASMQAKDRSAELEVLSSVIPRNFLNS